ncbi:MAG: YqaE/Pmp3 family membrane protein [Daejeonella sp.]
MTLIAIFFPFLSFLLRGKILTGIFCLILQITLIGWIPAAVWAVISLQNSRADRRNDRLVRAMRTR